MDILIKGIEMPKNCHECRFHSMQDVMYKACVIHLCYAQGIGQNCYVDEVPTKLHDRCPLVALPKHGRLTDLDKLYEHEKYNVQEALFDADEVLEDLKNAPVILEASE